MNRLLFLTLALLLCSSSPLAQEKPVGSDEIQIRQLERAWNQAEANQQVNEVSNRVDDTLDTDYYGSIMNKSEYMKWVGAPDQKADHLFDEGMTVHVYGNAAVVNGIYRESGTIKGKHYVIRSRYTTPGSAATAFGAASPATAPSSPSRITILALVAPASWRRFYFTHDHVRAQHRCAPNAQPLSPFAIWSLFRLTL
jgi:hypothetical protein